MAEVEPSWELYRSFLAVFDAGSLSGAASQLGLSQPTVGRHVEALERALRASLFLRHPRGLAPSEAARALEPSVRVMASAARAAARTASGPQDALEGVVRITASEVVGALVLPPILRPFRERHPGVVIELALSNRSEDLVNRQADIAVRMVAPTQASLVARKVGVVTLGLYAHRDHLARHGVPADAQALLAHPLLGFSSAPSVSVERIDAPIALTPELFAIRTDSDLAAIACLRAGLGVGFCQDPLAARDPDLVRLDIAGLRFELGVWVAMHEDLRRVRRLRAMFDHLVEGLTEYLAG